MDSVEAAQEFHGFKIERIETELTGLKKRVNSLEMKDWDILVDLDKLNGKVVELGISLTSSSSLQVWKKANNGIDEIKAAEKYGNIFFFRAAYQKVLITK